MIVITGASGRLGRLAAEEMARRGDPRNVQLTARDPARLEDLSARGFATARADYADMDSMVAAFSGAETLLLVSATGPVDKRIGLHRNAIEAARAAGVQHLVYTSRVNPVHESLYPFAPIHAEGEAALRESGLTTTIVRNNEYIENTIPAFDEAVSSGTLIMPGRTGKVAHIAVGEIAEILATILTTPGHEGAIYELNGSEAMDRDSVAAVIAGCAGVDVQTGPDTAEAFAEIRRRQGRPDFIVEMVKGLFTAIDAGEFDTVYPDAERLLGRRPLSMRDAVIAHFSRSAT